MTDVNVSQAKDNPDSALAAGPKPEFASRFADPSHPANSGSLVALLSGGAIQMPERNTILGGRGGPLGGRGDFDATRLDRNAMSGRGMSSRGPLGRGLEGLFEVAQPRNNFPNANRGMQQGLGASRGGRGGSSAGPLGIVQKVMKKVRRILTRCVDFSLTITQDVLYLLIVDMPSDDELAAAQGVASELLANQTRI